MKTLKYLSTYQDKAWFVFSLLLSLGFLLIIFCRIGSTYFANIYFSSDMFYSPVIYQDVFIDKTGFSGWHLNAAPNFFPDMFIYFFIMSIVGDFITANFIFSIGQYLTILILIYLLFYQVNKNKAFKYATFFNYLMFLFLLIPVFTKRFNLPFQLISISYHTGSFVMFLGCLNLTLWYFRKQSYTILILLFLAATLGVLNDRLFITQYIFAVLPLGFLVFIKHYRSTILKLLGTVILSLAVGLFLFRTFKWSEHITIISTNKKMFNFEDLALSFHTFWILMKTWILDMGNEAMILLITLLSLIGTFIYLLRSYKKIVNLNSKGEIPYQLVLLIIVFLYILITLLTPLLNGAFISMDIIRYNVMAFYIGLFLFPLLLMIWTKAEKWVSVALSYILPACTLIFLLIFLINTSKNNHLSTGLHNYFNYCPEDVKVIERLADEHDLKYGIGNYWYAKKYTMFSKEGLRIYAVFDAGLKPYYHTTNENWFHSGGKGKYKDPVFNYTVRRLDRESEMLEKIFPNSMDTLYLNVDENITVIKLPDFIIDRDTRDIVRLDKKE